MLAIVVQSLLLPYYISFERRIPKQLNAIMFVFDCIYFFDIYLQLSTAVRGRIHTITAITSIVIYKFKEISFLVDLIAVAPLDYFAAAMNASDHTMALLKMNRMLKLHKLIAFMKTREKDFKVDYLQVKLIKYIVIYLFMGRYKNFFFAIIHTVFHFSLLVYLFSLRGSLLQGRMFRIWMV